MTSLELKQERQTVLENAKALITHAEKEQRDLTPEESEVFEGYRVKAQELKQEITKAERKEYVDEQEKELAQSQRKTNLVVTRHDPRLTEKYGEDAFRAWALYQAGQHVPDHCMRAAQETGLNVRSKSIRLVEKRDMAVGTANAGQEFVAPEFFREIQEHLKSFGGMRAAARVIQTSTGADLSIPTWDDTDNVGEIIGEAAPHNSADPETDSVTLPTFKYSSKAVLASVEILQDSAFPLQSLLAEALGARIGRIQNAHFTDGTGTTHPEGLVVASAEGLDTTDGAIVYDDLVDMLGSVDRAYLSGGAAWMMNPKTKSYLMKLLDGNDRPLWLPDIVGGAPGSLLGYPIILNDDMDDIGADKFPVLFGSFKRAYVVRDCGAIEFSVNPYLYWESLQVGFQAWIRSGGVTVNANAVKHLKT